MTDRIPFNIVMFAGKGTRNVITKYPNLIVLLTAWWCELASNIRSCQITTKYNNLCKHHFSSILLVCHQVHYTAGIRSSSQCSVKTRLFHVNEQLLNGSNVGPLSFMVKYKIACDVLQNSFHIFTYKTNQKLTIKKTTTKKNKWCKISYYQGTIWTINISYIKYNM